LEVAAPGVPGNDTDPEGAVLYAILDTDVLHGILLLNMDGLFIYTPALDFFGVGGFTYHTCDPSKCSQPVTVTIAVHNIYDLYLPIIFKN
jgi:hypothetical protein